MSRTRKEARLARLQSLVDGAPRLGPETVHIDLTNACNTDCITCWDHSPLLEEPRAVAWKRQRADAGFVGELLDDIQSLEGLEAVILSGMGEPFTHPAIYEILADVKRRDLHVTVITNLAAADPERVLALDVDELLIGIHGASEASYLAFHPSFSPAHWQRLHDGLERFRAAGRRYKHVQVICEVNARELANMIALAHRYPAKQVNFKLASLKRGTERARITDEQRRWLLDEGIDAALARAEELEVAHNLDVFRAQVETGADNTAPIDEIGCFLGFHYSRITVERTVLYCCNTEVVVGQLDEGVRFSDLWRSERWASLRAHLKAGGFFPGCEQCGKLNQNVKLSARFREVFGEERWREVSGVAAREAGAGRARPLVEGGALRVLS